MAIQITQSDKDRLINIINEGVKVNQEIDDLREGLRETVKARIRNQTKSVKQSNPYRTKRRLELETR